jgi:hypothetical protein
MGWRGKSKGVGFQRGVSILKMEVDAADERSHFPQRFGLSPDEKTLYIAIPIKRRCGWLMM